LQDHRPRGADHESFAEIMTRNVVSCQKDADIATAARQMLNGHFGNLPVLDSHGQVARMITDRDIAMAAATRQRNASHIAVHEAMTGKVRSCFAMDEIGAALAQMEAARVRRLPVLDANGRLVGILSIDDIVERALDHPNGVSSAMFVPDFRRICAQPSIEPEPTAANDLDQ
jgi:CBS domain-containing protein